MQYHILFEKTVSTVEELKSIIGQVWRLLSNNVTVEVAIFTPYIKNIKFYPTRQIFHDSVYNSLRSNHYSVTVRVVNKPLE